MSLSRAFSSKGLKQTSRSRPSEPRKKRPAPFSIRLSEDERARLAMEAAGAPLGAYIKAKILATSPVRTRRRGLSMEDRKALAQVLALLGRARLFENLAQLAYAADIGALPLTPETENHLRATLHDVRDMRRLLLAALGHKVGDAP